MGHFPTGLRIKHTEEEEIAWDGYWKWWKKRRNKKLKSTRRKTERKKIDPGR